MRITDIKTLGECRLIWLGVIMTIALTSLLSTHIVESGMVSNPADRSIEFSEHLISSDYTYPYGIGAVDIDGDGDLDLTSADGHGNNCLYWFENDGTGRFGRHVIQKGEPNGKLERHRFADLNRDGRPDVVIVENLFGDVLWFENPGLRKKGQLWQKHYITKGGLLGAYDVDIADLNEDGYLDVAASSWSLGNKFVWYANPGPRQPKEWPSHVIDTLTGTTRNMRVADFNGDGHVDILGTSDVSSLVIWYENSGKPESDNWKRNVINFIGISGPELVRGKPVHGQPVDMDGDGDTDVLMALGGWGVSITPDITPPVSSFRFSDQGGAVVWYENLGMGEDRIGWKRHVISSDFPSGFEAVAADLDGDGDLDAVATAFRLGMIAWFENPGNPRGQWTKHLLKDQWKSANQVIIADLNQDKKPDIVAVAEYGSMELRWWRNEGQNKRQ